MAAFSRVLCVWGWQLVSRLIRNGLLSIGVLCGPGLWWASLVCFYASWFSDLPLASRVELSYVATVFGCWALWGISSGPWRLYGWWFGLASFLNMIAGSWLLRSDRPYYPFLGALFLGYSLWQFFIFRRR